MRVATVLSWGLVASVLVSTVGGQSSTAATGIPFVLTDSSPYGSPTYPQWFAQDMNGFLDDASGLVITFNAANGGTTGMPYSTNVAGISSGWSQPSWNCTTLLKSPHDGSGLCLRTYQNATTTLISFVPATSAILWRVGPFSALGPVITVEPNVVSKNTSLVGWTANRMVALDLGAQGALVWSLPVANIEPTAPLALSAVTSVVYVPASDVLISCFITGVGIVGTHPRTGAVKWIATMDSSFLYSADLCRIQVPTTNSLETLAAVPVTTMDVFFVVLDNLDQYYDQVRIFSANASTGAMLGKTSPFFSHGRITAIAPTWNGAVTLVYCNNQQGQLFFLNVSLFELDVVTLNGNGWPQGHTLIQVGRTVIVAVSNTLFFVDLPTRTLMSNQVSQVSVNEGPIVIVPDRSVGSTAESILATGQGSVYFGLTNMIMYISGFPSFANVQWSYSTDGYALSSMQYLAAIPTAPPATGYAPGVVAMMSRGGFVTVVNLPYLSFAAAAGPTVARDGIVYSTEGTQVLAQNVSSGATLWTATLPVPTNAQFMLAGDKLLVYGATFHIYSITLAHGNVTSLTVPSLCGSVTDLPFQPTSFVLDPFSNFGDVWLSTGTGCVYRFRATTNDLSAFSANGVPLQITPGPGYLVVIVTPQYPTYPSSWTGTVFALSGNDRVPVLDHSLRIGTPGEGDNLRYTGFGIASAIDGDRLFVVLTSTTEYDVPCGFVVMAFALGNTGSANLGERPALLKYPLWVEAPAVTLDPTIYSNQLVVPLINIVNGTVVLTSQYGAQLVAGADVWPQGKPRLLAAFNISQPTEYYYGGSATTVFDPSTSCATVAFNSVGYQLCVQNATNGVAGGLRLAWSSSVPTGYESTPFFSSGATSPKLFVDSDDTASVRVYDGLTSALLGTVYFNNQASSLTVSSDANPIIQSVAGFAQLPSMPSRVGVLTPPQPGVDDVSLPPGYLPVDPNNEAPTPAPLADRPVPAPLPPRPSAYWRALSVAPPQALYVLSGVGATYAVSVNGGVTVQDAGTGDTVCQSPTNQPQCLLTAASETTFYCFSSGAVIGWSPVTQVCKNNGTWTFQRNWNLGSAPSAFAALGRDMVCVAFASPPQILCLNGTTGALVSNTVALPAAATNAQTQVALLDEFMHARPALLVTTPSYGGFIVSLRTGGVVWTWSNPSAYIALWTVTSQYLFIAAPWANVTNVFSLADGSQGESIATSIEDGFTGFAVMPNDLLVAFTTNAMKTYTLADHPSGGLWSNKTVVATLHGRIGRPGFSTALSTTCGSVAAGMLVANTVTGLMYCVRLDSPRLESVWHAPIPLDFNGHQLQFNPLPVTDPTTGLRGTYVVVLNGLWNTVDGVALWSFDPMLSASQGISAVAMLEPGSTSVMTPLLVLSLTVLGQYSQSYFGFFATAFNTAFVEQRFNTYQHTYIAEGFASDGSLILYGAAGLVSALNPQTLELSWSIYPFLVSSNLIANEFRPDMTEGWPTGAIVHNGLGFAFGSGDTFVVITLSNQRLVATYSLSALCPGALAFSMGRQTITTKLGTDQVMIFTTGQCVFKYSSRNAALYSLMLPTSVSVEMTPVVDSATSRLWVGTYDGQLHYVDASTMTLLKSTQLESGQSIQYLARAGNLIYASSQTAVLMLDAQTLILVGTAYAGSGNVYGMEVAGPCLLVLSSAGVMCVSINSPGLYQTPNFTYGIPANDVLFDETTNMLYLLSAQAPEVFLINLTEALMVGQVAPRWNSVLQSIQGMFYNVQCGTLTNLDNGVLYVECGTGVYGISAYSGAKLYTPYTQPQDDVNLRSLQVNGSTMLVLTSNNQVILPAKEWNAPAAYISFVSIVRVPPIPDTPSQTFPPAPSFAPPSWSLAPGVTSFPLPTPQVPLPPALTPASGLMKTLYSQAALWSQYCTTAEGQTVALGYYANTLFALDANTGASLSAVSLPLVSSNIAVASDCSVGAALMLTSRYHIIQFAPLGHAEMPWWNVSTSPQYVNLVGIQVFVVGPTARYAVLSTNNQALLSLPLKAASASLNATALPLNNTYSCFLSWQPGNAAPFVMAACTSTTQRLLYAIDLVANTVSWQLTAAPTGAPWTQGFFVDRYADGTLALLLDNTGDSWLVRVDKPNAPVFLGVSGGQTTLPVDLFFSTVAISPSWTSPGFYDLTGQYTDVVSTQFFVVYRINSTSSVPAVLVKARSDIVSVEASFIIDHVILAATSTNTVWVLSRETGLTLYSITAWSSPPTAVVPLANANSSPIPPAATAVHGQYVAIVFGDSVRLALVAMNQSTELTKLRNMHALYASWRFVNLLNQSSFNQTLLTSVGNGVMASVPDSLYMQANTLSSSASYVGLANAPPGMPPVLVSENSITALTPRNGFQWSASINNGATISSIGATGSNAVVAFANLNAYSSANPSSGLVVNVFTFAGNNAAFVGSSQLDPNCPNVGNTDSATFDGSSSTAAAQIFYLTTGGPCVTRFVVTQGIQLSYTYVQPTPNSSNTYSVPPIVTTNAVVVLTSSYRLVGFDKTPSMNAVWTTDVSWSQYYTNPFAVHWSTSKGSQGGVVLATDNSVTCTNTQTGLLGSAADAVVLPNQLHSMMQPQYSPKYQIIVHVTWSAISAYSLPRLCPDASASTWTPVTALWRRTVDKGNSQTLGPIDSSVTDLGVALALGSSGSIAAFNLSNGVSLWNGSWVTGGAIRHVVGLNGNTIAFSQSQGVLMLDAWTGVTTAQYTLPGSYQLQNTAWDRSAVYQTILGTNEQMLVYTYTAPPLPPPPPPTPAPTTAVPPTTTGSPPKTTTTAVSTAASTTVNPASTTGSPVTTHTPTSQPVGPTATAAPSTTPNTATPTTTSTVKPPPTSTSAPQSSSVSPHSTAPATTTHGPTPTPSPSGSSAASPDSPSGLGKPAAIGIGVAVAATLVAVVVLAKIVSMRRAKFRAASHVVDDSINESGRLMSARYAPAPKNSDDNAPAPTKATRATYDVDDSTHDEREPLHAPIQENAA